MTIYYLVEISPEQKTYNYLKRQLRRLSQYSKYLVNSVPGLVRDDRVGIAATDGNNIYYSYFGMNNLWNKCLDDECKHGATVLVLGHEGGHVILRRLGLQLSKHQHEKGADFNSGIISGLVGVSLNTIMMVVFDVMNVCSSPTHPDRKTRLIKILEGYKMGYYKKTGIYPFKINKNQPGEVHLEDFYGNLLYKILVGTCSY